MNKFKLVPFVALTKEDAQLEEMNEQLTQLLKSPTLSTERKMALFQDMMARLNSYKAAMEGKRAPSVNVAVTQVEPTVRRAPLAGRRLASRKRKVEEGLERSEVTSEGYNPPQRSKSDVMDQLAVSSFSSQGYEPPVEQPQTPPPPPQKKKPTVTARGDVLPLPTPQRAPRAQPNQSTIDRLSQPKNRGNRVVQPPADLPQVPVRSPYLFRNQRGKGVINKRRWVFT